jgi:hypothetical protein
MLYSVNLQKLHSVLTMNHLRIQFSLLIPSAIQNKQVFMLHIVLIFNFTPFWFIILKFLVISCFEGASILISTE